jgi:hypothetical protein
MDAARGFMRSILGMKTWLPEETLKGLQQAQAFRREQFRMHFVSLSTQAPERRPRLGHGRDSHSSATRYERQGREEESARRALI